MATEKCPRTEGLLPATGAGPLLLLLTGLVSCLVLATAKAAVDPIPRLEGALAPARENYDAHPTNAVAAWHLGRVTFQLGEYVPKSKAREKLALEGAAACRVAISLSPDSAGAHYFLAMNLGQLARSRPLSALGIVREMEDEFTRTAELDPAFDYAGPERNLGLLYREAPGWPVSVGNRAKARHHLVRSVELAPNHPENRLHLAESAIQWRDLDLANAQVQALRTLLVSARDTYVGVEWEPVWVDWNQRWQKLLEDYEKLKQRKSR